MWKAGDTLPVLKPERFLGYVYLSRKPEFSLLVFDIWKMYVFSFGNTGGFLDINTKI